MLHNTNLNIQVKKYLKINFIGGSDILLENAGKDSTEPFANAGHTDGAKETLQKHIIGVLEGQENVEPKVLAVNKKPKSTQETTTQQPQQGFNFGLLFLPVAILGIVLYYVFNK